MNRWLTIFLLVLLPLQLSWAAGAVYCQHETASTASHFGHHVHQHKAGADSSNPSANGAIDTDCGTCHAGCASAIFEPVSLPTVTMSSDMHSGYPFRFSSHPPSLPERPNWADLA